MASLERGGQEFVDRYLDGDPDAVAKVDRWVERAASSFRRRLASEWDDVLQAIRLEVFKLLKKGHFRAESHLRTYLWKVTNHSCLDFIRQKERWRWTELADFGELLEASKLRSRQKSSQFETADLLLRVLEEVGEHCRKLWKLILEGRSYREMSELLQVSEGALRVRALRCRKQALEVRSRLLADVAG